MPAFKDTDADGKTQKNEPRKGITFRFPSPLYDELSASAERNQRTITREIEVRLTRSVDQDVGRGGREIAAFLDHLGAMAQLISSQMEGESPAARIIAIEQAFLSSITRFLRLPLEEAREALTGQIQQPDPDKYHAAISARQEAGAASTCEQEAVPLALTHAVAPGVLEFAMEPPTRTIANIQSLLYRRAILERAGVSPRDYALVIHDFEFSKVSFPASSSDALKNGAVDGLKQEQLYGLRAHPVTSEEWDWAENYDSCLAQYHDIEKETLSAQLTAKGALQLIEDRYGFKFTGNL